MKTKFKHNELSFVPAELFNQETNGERGRQFSYRQRRKWLIYKIVENGLRKYSGSILTSPRATKAQILEAWIDS